MPYVNILTTHEGATAEQKAELIRGATELLVPVPNQYPATSFVITDEVDTDNGGVVGKTVTPDRREAAARESTSTGPRP